MLFNAFLCFGLRLLADLLLILFDVQFEILIYHLQENLFVLRSVASDVVMLHYYALSWTTLCITVVAVILHAIFRYSPPHNTRPHSSLYFTPTLLYFTLLHFTPLLYFTLIYFTQNV